MTPTCNRCPDPKNRKYCIVHSEPVLLGDYYGTMGSLIERISKLQSLLEDVRIFEQETKIEED